MQVTKLENNKEDVHMRVAAYCRVSTDKDAQAESLENQMEAFRYRLALHKNWDLVKIYADEGLSGTSVKNRARFQEMLDDCRAGRVDYIITKSISRFARNTLDCIRYVRKLQAMGVQLYFEKEGIDTGDASSEMLMTVMASFAQEESRSISENTKWGIRKRFEAGHEVKVRLYGFRHDEKEAYQIVPEEAEIVREVFRRYVHGESRADILKDLIRRGVKPPAGDCWKPLQLDRMLQNEKYVGDSVLQKTYTESHLTHRQIRNHGQVPMYRVVGAHAAIVDRHIFEQAQKISDMKKICSGNSTYPYGDMLICPLCGKPLTHGSLSNFSYMGRRIQNGGWGCYGDGGCRKYLLIQNFLDAAVISSYNEKFDEEAEQVDFYWLDDSVEGIRLGEDKVTICWKAGGRNRVKLRVSDERFLPSAFADYYNGFLGRIIRGEQKNNCKGLMGLKGANVNDISQKRMRDKHEDNKSPGAKRGQEGADCGVLPGQHQTGGTGRQS